MQASELTIRLIVLLIPGIVAALIVETLTVHKTWNQFRFLLYAILLGFLSYLALQFVCLAQGVLCWCFCDTFRYTLISFWSALFDAKVPIRLSEVAGACFFAGLIGSVISAGVYYKLPNRLANRWRLTEKYGDESLFYYFLNATEIYWVYVRIPSKNLIFEGRRESFSETDKIRELVLRDVKVYSYEDARLLYEVPSVYLSMPANDILIEAVKEDRNNETESTVHTPA